MRILGKVVLLLVGVVVAVVQVAVAAYVVTGIRDTVQVRAHAKQARADLDAALPGARSAAAQWQRQQVAAHGAPTYAWSELRCEFDSVDAGWIPQSYDQSCSVRTVAMWPRQGAPALCAEDGDGRIASTRAIEAEESWPCPHDVTGEPTTGWERPLDGTRPDDLSGSPAWFVVESRDEITSTPIGCDPWGVIFCQEPMDQPAM